MIGDALWVKRRGGGWRCTVRAEAFIDDADVAERLAAEGWLLYGFSVSKGSPSEWAGAQCEFIAGCVRVLRGTLKPW